MPRLLQGHGGALPHPAVPPQGDQAQAQAQEEGGGGRRQAGARGPAQGGAEGAGGGARAAGVSPGGHPAGHLHVWLAAERGPGDTRGVGAGPRHGRRPVPAALCARSDGQQTAQVGIHQPKRVPLQAAVHQGGGRRAARRLHLPRRRAAAAAVHASIGAAADRGSGGDGDDDGDVAGAAGHLRPHRRLHHGAADLAGGRQGVLHDGQDVGAQRHAAPPALGVGHAVRVHGGAGAGGGLHQLAGGGGPARQGRLLLPVRVPEEGPQGAAAPPAAALFRHGRPRLAAAGAQAARAAQPAVPGAGGDDHTQPRAPHRPPQEGPEEKRVPRARVHHRLRARAGHRGAQLLQPARQEAPAAPAAGRDYSCPAPCPCLCRGSGGRAFQDCFQGHDGGSSDTDDNGAGGSGSSDAASGSSGGGGSGSRAIRRRRWGRSGGWRIGAAPHGSVPTGAAPCRRGTDRGGGCGARFHRLGDIEASSASVRGVYCHR
mmetsp:Transcript_30638/g.77346  ORF Transcript_30638/g.77346 Transcript_30638/m.77346 type:complete len:485 (+) Transcript_30638:1885-3339(+)